MQYKIIDVMLMMCSDYEWGRAHVSGGSYTLLMRAAAVEKKPFLQREVLVKLECQPLARKECLKKFM